MRVVWTRPALLGVQQAYDYFAEFNPQAAQRMANALLAAADRMVNFPHRGRPVPNTPMRELVTSYPYVIRYLIDTDTVVILRIRHTSRRPTSP